MWLLAFRNGASCGIFIIIASISLACLEIEIEGANGWAYNLPTFKKKCWLCGKKPLTGYHIFLSTTILIISFTAIIVDYILLSFTINYRPILFVLSLFVFVMITEDISWFLLNYQYKDALKNKKAVNHFGSIYSQFILYVFSYSTASTLWLLAYIDDIILGFASLLLLLVSGSFFLLIESCWLSVLYEYMMKKIKREDTSNINIKNVIDQFNNLLNAVVIVLLFIISSNIWSIKNYISHMTLPNVFSPA